MGDPTARILVCDDENFYREAIRDILGAEGLEVVEAFDGESAIELAADPSLGVAILDIRLPGIDGIEVLRTLRDARPDMRIIMLSAHTDQELVLEALRLGANDYLAKPLHDEELVLAVRRARDAFRVADDLAALRARLARLADACDAPGRWGVDGDADERAEAVARAAVDVAAEVLDAAKTSLLWLDDSGDTLRVAAAHGRKIDAADMDGVAIGEAVAGAVFASRSAALVASAHPSDRFTPRAPGERYDSASFVVVPVVAAGEALGVLCATDRTGGGEFAPDDLVLLRALAAHVAARVLAGEGTAASAERAVDPGFDTSELDEGAAEAARHVASVERDADLVRAVCEAMTTEVEPARVFAKGLEAVAKGLGAAPASLFLIDNAADVLRCEAADDGGEREERAELPTRGGLTGAVLQTGRLVATDAPTADARFDASIDTPADGRSGPMVCVPLSLRGKVVGVFRAFPRDAAEASARSAELLAAALSAAVRNALLYRSLLESIDEVAEARRAARR
ncbi:MAG: response regulator [Myxococcales bacterium]|nr:response regulator [Myxococcales bacterium]